MGRELVNGDLILTNGGDLVLLSHNGAGTDDHYVVFNVDEEKLLIETINNQTIDPLNDTEEYIGNLTDLFKEIKKRAIADD